MRPSQLLSPPLLAGQAVGACAPPRHGTTDKAGAPHWRWCRAHGQTRMTALLKKYRD